MLDCPETPGGCWGWYAAIEMEGFRSLEAGQQVTLEWEAPGFKQDGYDYRAVRIVPRAGHKGWASLRRLTSMADINGGGQQRKRAGPDGNSPTGRSRPATPDAAPGSNS